MDVFTTYFHLNDQTPGRSSLRGKGFLLARSSSATDHHGGQGWEWLAAVTSNMGCLLTKQEIRLLTTHASSAFPPPPLSSPGPQPMG